MSHVVTIEAQVRDPEALRSSCRRLVYAVDPNCPASGDGVTHPHVQSDSLCEGEGMDAIRRALDEGRLYDFFCVVDHILRNYNPDSAYVQLEDWNGINCRACGDTVDSNEVIAYSKCESESCVECSVCCASCSAPAPNDACGRASSSIASFQRPITKRGSLNTVTT